MNSSMVVIGITLLLIGAVLFLFVYNRIAELQTGLGQLARALNKSLQAGYEGLQLIEFLGGFLAIAGLGVTIFGAAMKVQRKVEAFRDSKPTPRLPPPTTYFSKAHCTFCGTELSEQDIFCRKCGKVVPSPNSTDT